jgi:hypothetical protein
MRVKTDGEVAAQVNKIVRSLRQLESLSGRGFGTEVVAKRETELKARIAELIASIEASEHPAAADIAASVRGDNERSRTRFVAAGARRFFAFERNWLIDKGELRYSV